MDSADRLNIAKLNLAYLKHRIELDKRAINNELSSLIVRAARLGLIITVETVPGVDLRMGNCSMKSDVRSSRASYQEVMRLEEAAK